MKLKTFSITFGILMFLSGALVVALTIVSLVLNNNENDIVINVLAMAINAILFFIESFLFFRGITHPAILLPGLCFRENSKLNKGPLIVITIGGLIGLVFTILFALESSGLTNLFSLNPSDNYLFLSISLTLLINAASALIFALIARFEVYWL